MKQAIINRKRARKRGEFRVFNNPSIKVNEIVNLFVRKLEQGKIFSFTSGNDQKTIKFKLLEDGYIYLLTEAGDLKEGELKDKCQKISVNTLKHACYELMRLKTVTRNEFEKFSNFWSSLFAIILSVYMGCYKKIKTPNGSIRITLIGTRVIFSGVSASSNSDWNAMKENGVAFVMKTYTDVKQSDNWQKKLLENILDEAGFDNGMFKFFNDLRKGKVGVKPEIDEFCDFINESKELISFVINIDDPDPEITDRNQSAIEERTGIKPIPVWHPADNFMDHDWSRLEQMIKQDHAVIAIGKTVFKGESFKRELFDELFKRFPNQNFHWLGGASQLLLDYPWFSSDISSWWKGREPKPQLTVFQGFQAATKRLEEGVVTKEEGLTFNIQMLQNIEFMNWPLFKRSPEKAPYPHLEELWQRVYEAKKAKIDPSKSKKADPYQPKQLDLFDEELAS